MSIEHLDQEHAMTEETYFQFISKEPSLATAPSVVAVSAESVKATAEQAFVDHDLEVVRQHVQNLQDLDTVSRVKALHELKKIFDLRSVKLNYEVVWL
jgi:hypothetical protein